MTRDLVAAGLVVNPRVEEYDGTTAVVRNAHLPPEESSSFGGRRSDG